MGRLHRRTELSIYHRGAWSAQEDVILREYVKMHGNSGWGSVSQKTGLQRCGKSCRFRWLNYLRPGIKRGNISPAEEELILKLHGLLGNRWSLIAGRMPGRTDYEIKNYWNIHLCKRRPTKEDHREHQRESKASPDHFDLIDFTNDFTTMENVAEKHSQSNLIDSRIQHFQRYAGNEADHLLESQDLSSLMCPPCKSVGEIRIVEGLGTRPTTGLQEMSSFESSIQEIKSLNVNDNLEMVFDGKEEDGLQYSEKARLEWLRGILFELE